MEQSMQAEVEARIIAQRDRPVYERLQRWAIEADVECSVEGHPAYIDGRCVRCRAYEPQGHPEDVGLQEHQVTIDQGHCYHYTSDQGCPLHGETCQG